MIPILTVATKPEASAFEKLFFYLKAGGRGNVGRGACRRMGVGEYWSQLTLRSASTDNRQLFTRWLSQAPSGQIAILDGSQG
jgi:hypothetical protein